MHQFHTVIPYAFFFVIINLPVSQSLNSGSWIYPLRTFPVFNYIDTVNASWTTSIPEPHVLLIWCHPQERPKDYYLLVYNETLPSGHKSQEVVLNFENRPWKLCHFDLKGEYEYALQSPDFSISMTDASEPIKWGKNVPTADSTSHIKAISTYSLAEDNVSANDVLPKTQTNHFSSAFTPFASPSSSSSSSSSSVIPIAAPKLPPSSRTLSPTSQALIGVGIVVWLSLVLAIISILACKRKRQSRQQQQQQHQGLSGPPGGGKVQEPNNNKHKQKISKRHQYQLRELAGEEVANELDGRPGFE